MMLSFFLSDVSVLLADDIISNENIYSLVSSFYANLQQKCELW